MIRRFTIPALLMSSVLVFSACGDDDDAAGGSSDGGGSSADYCDVALKANTAFDDIGNATDADSFKAGFEVADDLIDSVEGNVPDEIADAFDLVVERYEVTRDAFAEADYDPSKIDPEVLTAFDDPKYDDAENAVDAYDTEVCGAES